MRKALLSILGILAILYLIAMGVAFARQRAMIYPAPAARALQEWPAGFRDLALETADGLELKAIYKPAAADLPTLVFFHGNGDDLQGALAATSTLAGAGYGLLIPEYRGYGGNPGSPSEAGLYRDGEAALQWLGHHGGGTGPSQGKLPPGRIILIGNSLGSGVATELASKHRIAGLVLISGFARFSDIAARQMPIFPARLLLLDRYENAAKLAHVDAPVLILHGAEDGLVPLSQGEVLAKAARRGTLIVVPHAGHELAYLPQSQARILEWLSKL